MSLACPSGLLAAGNHRRSRLFMSSTVARFRPTTPASALAQLPIRQEFARASIRDDKLQHRQWLWLGSIQVAQLTGHSLRGIEVSRSKHAVLAQRGWWTTLIAAFANS